MFSTRLFGWESRDQFYLELCLETNILVQGWPTIVTRSVNDFPLAFSSQSSHGNLLYWRTDRHCASWTSWKKSRFMIITDNNKPCPNASSPLATLISDVLSNYHLTCSCTLYVCWSMRLFPAHAAWIHRKFKCRNFKFECTCIILNNVFQL